MKNRLISGVAAVIVFSMALSLSGQRTAIPGSPLAGITGRELELFRAGLDDFSEVETADDGLGPAFNGTSCAVCHSIPAVGGIGTMTEVRGGYRDEEGNFHELYGGTLYHLFSNPPHRCQVQIPPEVNILARRAPLPVFGDGLVEAIADETIASHADPDDLNNDGIRGRVAWVEDLETGQRRAGRFGWKAQHATLLSFSADAYRNEMGITNDLMPNEMALGIDAQTMKECSPKEGLEDVRDRRTGLRGIDNFTNFMRFLAPVERGPVDDATKQGEALFSSIGCASCHLPVLMTAPNANPLFDRKLVPLYSDLLLHDVGTGDGIPQAAAKENEIRTPPLWGLRFRRPLMHDGATVTPAEAILRHRGEATDVINRFAGLSEIERKDLIAFLNSL